MRPKFGLCEKATSPKEILKSSIISYLINANQSNPNMEKFYYDQIAKRLG